MVSNTDSVNDYEARSANCHVAGETTDPVGAESSQVLHPKIISYNKS
jgi:hypothetical protein